MATPEPHLLELEPILKPKVWGGRRLAGLGRALPASTPIGESWEIADLAATAASGGGGGSARSRIASGPLAGRTLADALALWGPACLGSASLSGAGGFPLLVKLLDAREDLSVQVHPSPAYAASHPGAHLKAECWFVLDAAASAEGTPAAIYAGLAPGVSASDLVEAVAAREPGRVPAALRRIEVKPGEMYFLPSGIVHALGAGVLVAEIQTPSDTTFRVYDWEHELGRLGRELHLDEALACLIDDAAPVRTTADDGVLVDQPEFGVELVRAGTPIAPADSIRAVLACAPGRTRALVIPAGVACDALEADALVATPRERVRLDASLRQPSRSRG